MELQVPLTIPQPRNTSNDDTDFLPSVVLQFPYIVFRQALTKQHGEIMRKRIARFTSSVATVLILLITLAPITVAQPTIDEVRHAAEQGDVEAQANLGSLYFNGGGGVELSHERAAKWYQLAAEQGHAEAQFKLGFLYANGFKVPQDWQIAAEWYQLAAEQGHVIAQFNLGLIYANGGFGVPQDWQIAAKWYKLAAEQGYADAIANLELIDIRR